MLTEVKNNIKIMVLQIKYNLMREMTNSVTFIMNILFMVLNNATFLVQWVILFSLKDNFGGYGFNEVLLIWSIATASYGLAHVLFNGINKMPKLIEDGKIDSFLVLPKNTLLMIATSSTSVSALGDLLYGYIILCIFNFSVYNLLMFTILIIPGALIFISLSCILNSLTFYFTRSSYLKDSIMNIFIYFSTYPDSIFHGIVKVILFTVIPVGFAIFLPVRIIMKFNLLYLLSVIGVTALIVFLAFFAFYKGLKRYTSSNLMVARV